MIKYKFCFKDRLVTSIEIKVKNIISGIFKLQKKQNS